MIRATLLVVLLFLNFKISAQSPTKLPMKLTFLALGDSYTIGESVNENERWPNQAVKLLKEKGIHFEKPEIIAKTGWTTFELEAAIDERNIQQTYDWVSLLIGVNNQYRGLSLFDYQIEFERLLKKAIVFSGKKPNHVVVFSIPDWGVTPFAKGRNRKQIAEEIDQFNAVNRKISEAYKVNYIEITQHTRLAEKNLTLIASDGLHPSAVEYLHWAKQFSELIN
jgi:lysophospholipase L1-like esterase